MAPTERRWRLSLVAAVLLGRLSRSISVDARDGALVTNNATALFAVVPAALRQMPAALTPSNPTATHTRPCSPETDSMLFTGKWVAGAPKVPPCCGGDHAVGFVVGHPSKLWDKKCGTTVMKGTFKRFGGSDLGSAWASTFGEGCQCRNTVKWFQEDSPLPRLRNYEWSTTEAPPDACTVQPWNAAQFCGVPPYRTIKLIGDSITSQVASVLINTIKEDGGGCHHAISYDLADSLIGREMMPNYSDENPGSHNRGRHWLDIVRQDMPDIVVLNTGPHVRGDENFTAILREVIKDAKVPPPDIVAAYERAGRAPPSVVWRTNAPGGCTNEVVKQWGAKNSTAHPAGADSWYNFFDFLRWDNAVAAALPKVGIPVIDLRMLHLRSDAHTHRKTRSGPDCLHFCLRDSALFTTFPRMLQHTIGSIGGGGGALPPAVQPAIHQLGARH